MTNTSKTNCNENVEASGKLTSSIEDNIKIIKQIFANDETITFREFESSEQNGIKCSVIYIDSMVKQEIINDYILKPIMNSSLKESSKCVDIVDVLSKNIIVVGEVTKSSDIDELIGAVIYGNTVLLVEGVSEALIINTVGWKTRAISEPTTETIVRGPREGFTESLSINISLIRRRINNPELKFQFKDIGVRTKTKLCICYLQGVAQEKILQELINRLEAINIDGVLDSGYIEELIKDSPFSIFRTIGATERPDIVASKLLEGRIAVICDGSPFVLTLPYIFVEGFQANEDYYNNFIYASVNRVIRFIGFFLTTSIPSIYVALITYHQELIPTQLIVSISQARRGVPFPTVMEAFGMLLVFEILREAGTRIPKHVGQAISIVGALVLGEAAVNARFVSAPMVIITAMTGISAFLVPQVLSIIVIRIIFLLLSAFFGLYGYIFAVMGLVLHMVSLRSFGVPFMLNTGIGTIRAQDLKDTAIRAPWKLMYLRPRYIAKNFVRQKSNKS